MVAVGRYTTLQIKLIQVSTNSVMMDRANANEASREFSLSQGLGSHVRDCSSLLTIIFSGSLFAFQLKEPLLTLCPQSLKLKVDILALSSPTWQRYDRSGCGHCTIQFIKS